MTDNDFVVELARRINTFFEQDANRTRTVLSTPIRTAGYASVAHFLGEVCMPKMKEMSPETLAQSLLLIPQIEEGRIMGLQVITIEEFEAQAKKAQEPPVH